MSESINLPDFILNIISRLKKNGFETYAVGGCVRNGILKIPVHDYDIATSAVPEETEKIFSDMRIIETGIKHGTITVLANGFPVEITTFRKDGEYKNHRKPESVEFTDSIIKDLSRRDFTVNAIAFSPEKGIIDPFGGQKDLRNGILRCVGNADERFEEDALRIMRAMRFMTEYGFEAEKETAAAINNKKELLKDISAERITAELIRMLCANGNYLRKVLSKFGEVLSVIIPEISDCIGFEQHTRYHDKDVWEHTAMAVASIEPEAHLRLAMLFHDLGKPASYSFYGGSGHFKGHALLSEKIFEKFAIDFHLDNETEKKTLFLIKRHDIEMNDNPVLIKKRMNKFGKSLYFDLLKVHIADDLAKSKAAGNRIPIYHAAEETGRKIVFENECYSLKSLNVNGNDIINEGFKGREVGLILDFLLSAVIEGKCSNEKNELLEYLRENYIKILLRIED